MSFNADFDYTPVVNAGNQRIAEIQAQKTIDENNYTAMSTSAYASLLPMELEHLQAAISDAATSIAGYKAINDEIARIMALPDDNKMLIYYFYSVLGIPKPNYMAKLLFNTDKLSNDNVLALYNDTTIDSQLKLTIAKLLYDQFSIDTTYKEILNVASYLV
jgi:hypothetical protein